MTDDQRVAACYGFDFSSFKNAPKELLAGDAPLRDQARVLLAHQGKRIDAASLPPRVVSFPKAAGSKF